MAYETEWPMIRSEKNKMIGVIINYLLLTKGNKNKKANFPKMRYKEAKPAKKI